LVDIQRDFERDIIPMCRAEGMEQTLSVYSIFPDDIFEGMGLVPWNVIASGRLRSDVKRNDERDWRKGAND